MTFFEDAVVGVKSFGKTVGKKTGVAVDITRLKVSAAEINKEISRRYEALGRIIYDSQKSGTDISGITGECVKSIDALYARLDDVNGRMAKLQDRKYCPSCAAVVDKKSLYCSRCGERLENQ